MRLDKFPHYVQLDNMDCGPTCLRMIAKYYGKHYSLKSLREFSYISREGVSLLGISDAAESIGFRTSGLRISLNQLINDVPLPCILHWQQDHFVVCYKIKKKRSGYVFYISDPAEQKITYDEEIMRKCWLSTRLNGVDMGTALALEPSVDFYEKDDEHKMKKRNLLFFMKYLSPYKKQLFQLVLGMVLAGVLQLILPFLTQSLVDVGIKTGDVNFVFLILISQLVIAISQLSVEYIRSWILLNVNTRINISLVSDFLAKLMKLPLSFFDTKMIGDILQRIEDHTRIETFLTGSSITTMFSFFNFFIFAIVLGYYDYNILLIFIIGNMLYVSWILIFMKYRRELDIKRFAQAAGEQNNLIQLVTGMQEIKLNNSEKLKRWQWERIQVKLFKISVKGLALGQVQQVGSIFFNQTTNIIISFIAAKAVINGDMTLGMMMAITYIIGQLNAPINSFINFAQQLQDAKISLERLNEVHEMKDEEQDINTKLTILPENRNIQVNNLYFTYDGANRNFVLSDINIIIPQNKITAIVGSSGSGKTTLVKLLLGFYMPNLGNVKVGETPMSEINPHLWRSVTGSVMQDGFIFSDTIANNIAVGDETVDINRLRHAVAVANIKDFIESLPLSYNTKIGMEGNGISQGQRQRLLIARAVYKNPEYLFFDEATNALDANNEKEIMCHLQSFYRGKTVVIVAHRLSTVKHADNIIVLDKGAVVEEGSHQELINKKGLYFTLVKNQLELGG